MRMQTTICKVDVGQTLDDLKEEMLSCLEDTPVFGIFNGELYVAYQWAATINDIEKY